MKILITALTWKKAGEVRRLLEIGGHEVLSESSALEGLRTAVRERPEVMVLEQELPDYPGIEVLRRARKILPGIRVIIVLRYNFASVRKKILAAGAWEVFSSAMSAAECAEAIQNRPEGFNQPRSALEKAVF